MNAPNITEFLSEKTIFITGATGFIGKAIVEKILAEVPKVKRLYLLVRPQENLDAAARLKELLNSSVFDALRERLKDEFEPRARKLHAISGDLSQEKLGIDPSLSLEIQKEIDLIVHSAASIDFDAPVDESLETNTLGPHRVLEFAKACAKKPTLAHLSTAFIHGRSNGLVSEENLQVNSTPMDSAASENFQLNGEIESIRAMSLKAETQSRALKFHENFLLQAFEKLHLQGRLKAEHLPEKLHEIRRGWAAAQLARKGRQRARALGWNDTYTFTKAMGEQILIRDSGPIALRIIRPSVVESSLEHPSIGWLERLRAGDLMLSYFGKGRLKTFPGKAKNTIDWIPVDFVVNATLAALASNASGTETYHVASSAVNPLTLQSLGDNLMEAFRKNPMLRANGKPFRPQKIKVMSLQRFCLMYRICYWLPLWICDGCLRLTAVLPWPKRWIKRVAKLKKALEKLLYFTKIYKPYMMAKPRFCVKKLQALHHGLCPEDRQRYPFDPQDINWAHYIQEVHIPSIVRQSSQIGQENPIESEC